MWFSWETENVIKFYVLCQRMNSALVFTCCCLPEGKKRPVVLEGRKTNVFVQRNSNCAKAGLLELPASPLPRHKRELCCKQDREATQLNKWFQSLMVYQEKIKATKEEQKALMCVFLWVGAPCVPSLCEYSCHHVYSSQGWNSIPLGPDFSLLYLIFWF